MDYKGQPWGHDTPPPLNSKPMRTGEIQEFSVRGIRYHPIHMHVNPMQIVRIVNDEYYLPGDWHDTFFPMGTGYGTVRVALDQFPGKMIVHCHLLEHEDNGMMGWFN